MNKTYDQCRMDRFAAYAEKIRLRQYSQPVTEKFNNAASKETKINNLCSMTFTAQMSTVSKYSR